MLRVLSRKSLILVLISLSLVDQFQKLSYIMLRNTKWWLSRSVLSLNSRESARPLEQVPLLDSMHLTLKKLDSVIQLMLKKLDLKKLQFLRRKMLTASWTPLFLEDPLLIFSMTSKELLTMVSMSTDAYWKMEDSLLVQVQLKLFSLTSSSKKLNLLKIYLNIPSIDSLYPLRSSQESFPTMQVWILMRLSLNLTLQMRLKHMESISKMVQLQRLLNSLCLTIYSLKYGLLD